MSEIDVTECEYKGGIECHIRDYPILNCADVKIEDCHYKQIQQLKAENENLKDKNNSIHSIAGGLQQRNHNLTLENEELKEKLEKIKRLCINKEEARLLYGYKDFDSYDIIRIIESEN